MSQPTEGSSSKQNIRHFLSALQQLLQKNKNYEQETHKLKTKLSNYEKMADEILEICWNSGFRFQGVSQSACKLGRIKELVKTLIAGYHQQNLSLEKFKNFYESFLVVSKTHRDMIVNDMTHDNGHLINGSHVNFVVGMATKTQQEDQLNHQGLSHSQSLHSRDISSGKKNSVDAMHATISLSSPTPMTLMQIGNELGVILPLRDRTDNGVNGQVVVNENTATSLPNSNITLRRSSRKIQSRRQSLKEEVKVTLKTISIGKGKRHKIKKLPQAATQIHIKVTRRRCSCGTTFTYPSRLERHLYHHSRAKGSFQYRAGHRQFEVRSSLQTHPKHFHGKEIREKQNHSDLMEDYIELPNTHSSFAYHITPETVKKEVSALKNESLDVREGMNVDVIGNHERAAPCECTCGKTYGLPYKLTKHLNYYRDQGNFWCGICGINYADSSGLRRHRNSKHCDNENKCLIPREHPTKIGIPALPSSNPIPYEGQESNRLLIETEQLLM